MILPSDSNTILFSHIKRYGNIPTVTPLKARL